ncbi:PREDICTED: uncharacterized protein LOC107341759 [Acropora digitifera]|uniref:uncharacterized protein LOC107341759 n=1 Tax=Acropora digitifera TaxID=70779 RepID=UPI00077A2F28|nr:PREDICTED: uncharacterized protein LOC107341759 [Acropora digitifera]
MVIPQKYENQLYTDIVRSLKQNLRREVHRSSSSETKGKRKVRIRTECYYKSQLLDDHWREKYNRHVAQSVRGFYTPAHIPYASVGDICLDVKDLVLSTIQVRTPRRSVKLLCKNVSIITDASDQEQKGKEEKAATGQKQSQRKDKKACYSSNDQGGLRDIKAVLFQYRGRLSSLRAGESFLTRLAKEDSMSMVVETMKEEVNQKRQSQLSSAKLKQLMRKDRLSEHLDPLLSADDWFLAFPSDVTKPEHEEEAIDQRDLHERCLRNFSNKLSCLNRLLCSIYHLRTKDLRSKVPLSRDYLMALGADVQRDKKGRPLRHTRNIIHLYSQSHGGHQRSSTDVTLSRMEHDNHMSPYANTRSSFVSDSPSSLFRPGLTGTGTIESRASFNRKLRLIRDTSDKIETWEDLLEAGDKPSSNAQAPSQGAWRGGPTRTSLLHPGKVTVGGARIRKYGIQALAQQHQSYSSFEHAPIWQQVAASEKSAKESTNANTFQKRRAKRSFSKIKSSLSVMTNEGFADIQAKSAEKVQEKLSKLKRMERETFMKKFAAFKPTSLYKVDLQRVRQAGHAACSSSIPTIFQCRYETLEQEAIDIGVASELEVIVLLEKLCLFSTYDITTIPFVQAKLCLLVQSLPVYELCTLTMMEALKFLITKILSSSITTFNDWMNHRKLLPEDKYSSDDKE